MHCATRSSSRGVSDHVGKYAAEYRTVLGAWLAMSKDDQICESACLWIDYPPLLRTILSAEAETRTEMVASQNKVQLQRHSRREERSWGQDPHLEISRLAIVGDATAFAMQNSRWIGFACVKKVEPLEAGTILRRGRGRYPHAEEPGPAKRITPLWALLHAAIRRTARCFVHCYQQGEFCRTPQRR